MNKMDAVRKAAILLVSLNDATASEVLKYLDTEIGQKISDEIRVLGEIRQEERNQAIGDFLKEVLGQEYGAAATVLGSWIRSTQPISFPRFTVED